MQLFNSFNSRSIALKDFNIVEGYFNSFLHLFILIIEFAATWLMILIGGKIFRTAHLSWPMIGGAFGFGVLTIGIAAALKTIPEPYLEKIPDLINEKSEEGNNVVSFVNKHVSNKGPKRSETERLLDSA